jgi:ubiquinone/menaquinone biosynthesis C-methylase UbiE
MDIKSFAELSFWKWQKFRQKQLSNTHYQPFFTDFFGLSTDFYQDKRILDIGCGPRGSLEWADMAKERIGLDPLANEYLKLGAKQHQMQYVASGSEDIPFESAYFDVVSSFNSLDHVENVEKTIAEIARVLKSGGLFLLLTDVGHKPTITEPRSFGWEIMEQFSPHFSVISQNSYEKSVKGAMYQSLRNAVPYNFQNPKERYGLLSAMLAKR